jgi:DENN (AEX-3) domain
MSNIIHRTSHNELSHQLHAPVMQSKEQVIVFDHDHEDDDAVMTEDPGTTPAIAAGIAKEEQEEQNNDDTKNKNRASWNRKNGNNDDDNPKNNGTSMMVSEDAASAREQQQQEHDNGNQQHEEEEDQSKLKNGGDDDDHPINSTLPPPPNEDERTGEEEEEDGPNHNSTTQQKTAARLFETARTFQTNWRKQLPSSASEAVSSFKLQQVWRTTTSASSSSSADNNTSHAAAVSTAQQQLRAKLSDSVETFRGRYKTAVASSATVSELLTTAKTTLQTAVTSHHNHNNTNKPPPPAATAPKKLVPKPLPPSTVTMLLGKGMLGVNLKPTLLPNNGVYVDYLVPYHAAEISGVVHVGDLVLSVGDNIQVRYGTVVTVPTAIANAIPRPVTVTFGKHGDPITTNDMPIHHIDLLIALVYRNQPGYYEEEDEEEITQEEEEVIVVETTVPVGGDDISIETTNTNDPTTEKHQQQQQEPTKAVTPESTEPATTTNDDDDSKTALEPEKATATTTETTEPEESATSSSSSSFWPEIESILVVDDTTNNINLLVLQPAAQTIPTPYIHQRVRSFALDDVEIHTALRNALFETIYDGRRRDYFARFVEYEFHDPNVHKYLLLAAEILSYHEFAVAPYRLRPHKIYHNYLAPTALLDCHGICADSELREIERLLAEADQTSSSEEAAVSPTSSPTNANANMYNGYFVAALEQLETAFYEFCQSPDCARMRAYLRGTKPLVKLPLTEIVQDPYQFNFCVVHAMTINAAADLFDDSNHRQKYISTKAFAKFRTSVYHEYMLQGMSVAKLLRLAELPPHVSVHKPMIIDAEENETATTTKPVAATVELAQAVLLLRGESAEQSTREICEPLFASCDLEVPLQVESYAWSSTPFSLIDFCVPRAETGDALYGVSLSLPPAAATAEGGADTAAAGEMMVLVLLSTCNTIVPMREILRRFHATHGSFDVEDLKGKILTLLKEVAEEFEVANGAAAATPEDLFLTRSGELLIKSLTPIPLALVFLTALLEQKIIFLSSRRSLLLAATTVIQNLLQPLQWCHLLVPMVPPALIHDLLQYPAPFLLGLESSSNGSASTDVVRDLPHDVTLVDLDVGRVILGTADDELRPSILAMAQKVGTKLGQAMDPETWRCDDLLLGLSQPEPNEPIRGFAALQTFCHDFCHHLVANTTSCCYKVGDTILFDESSFKCTGLDDDPSLKDLFLRSQAMNRYIGTRRPDEMKC